MADQARDAGWSFEDYLAAVLEREVSARNASGAELRIKAAEFPTRKTLEGSFSRRGTKTFTPVEQAKSASVSLNSRLLAIPAGEVTVEVTGVVDGQTVTVSKSAAYPAPN